MTGNAEILQAGFADPVFDSQRAFRTVLGALSEPGLVAELDPALTPPPGLEPATAIALLTLADYETPVWLPPALAAGAAGRWLRFHAGAPLTTTPADSAYAVITAGAEAPELFDFHPGDDQFPDRSTTIFIQCTSLEGGLPVILAGPGIPGSRRFAPQGPVPEFWRAAAANHARYPLGVDCLFTAGRRIAGLPRSTRIETGETR
ncbi:phosphonate C-P lyase system protein PhnH [Rhabdaerophilum calidifontis]|uniref:phosphonate C-P lyase system protein PhnH n=1 Tax=Rhabdaerophilum calidifontis TaxID=2604328 RepID=UPI00123C2388|nr:phosphonate C-P lyase system protein PhnH [Rhabdaerophilum calidifontis]